MSSSDTTPAAASQGEYGDIDAAAETVLALAEKALNAGESDQISEAAVQKILTAGSRLFANKVEMEDRFFCPFTSPDSVTATDVVVTVSDMLRAANLNTFDLAMWFRRPRPDDQ